MKILNIAAFGIMLSVLGAGHSMASDADNQITQISPSIIMIGIADPCADGACDEVVVVEASEKSDGNAPLVNANGMPTGEPVIMRPSVETTAVQATVNPATITEPPAQTAEATPAADGAATAPAEAPVIAAEPDSPPARAKETPPLN